MSDAEERLCMNRVLRAAGIVAVNLAVLLAILAGIEGFFRWREPDATNDVPNGLWQRFSPYVMFTTAPGSYKVWTNQLTGASIPSTVVTNALGFNDPREFDFTKPYKTAPNEKVVLFTGGSVAWGVGATAPDSTVAGRMQHYLNQLQHDVKYTVVNFGMGGYIAYQQFLALSLWGESFDPDWIVAMDGFNDAVVGCASSQGVGNPLNFAVARALITAYMFGTKNPVFFRGQWENQLIKYSAAYRRLSGQTYIENDLKVDNSSSEMLLQRRAIIPTRIGESRQILAFYLKGERDILGLFPRARYILSTQPVVNMFSGDFVNVYDFQSDSVEHRTAMNKRAADLEDYLTAHQTKDCSAATMQPSYTYIYVLSAFRLEQLVEEQREKGRLVDYYNIGTLFPNERTDRIKYFIDPAHLSDEGMDVIGEFYAKKILAAENKKKSD
jgi:lysophospholipase L1-like esterase